MFARRRQCAPRLTHTDSCYTLQWAAPFPLNIAPSHGGSEPPFNTRFLGPTRVHRPKQHLDRFSHFCTAHGRESLHCTIGHPFSLKTAPSKGDLLIRFFWTTLVRNQNCILISSAVFAWLTTVTDGHTTLLHL